MRLLIGGLLLAFSGLVAGQSLPAFYGAEGGGATSVGGRGGVVCAVTNLNNSGSGSLRGCIDTHNNTTGSKMTVVFRVGGTINLQSALRIRSPHITIAGQTAPGGGILLRDNTPSTNNTLFAIQAPDVIVRFIRFRGGYRSDGGRIDLLAITGVDNQRIIFDNNSLSWSSRRLIRSDSSSYVTLSRNIFSEALRSPSGVGLLLGFSEAGNEATTRYDIHRNLTMSNGTRNPLLGFNESTWINNINYNWGGLQGVYGENMMLRGGVTMDIINNIYKRGPFSNSVTAQYAPPCAVGQCEGVYCIVRDPSFYINGNLGAGRTDLNIDNWQLIQGTSSADPSCSPTGQSPFTLPLSYRRNTPLSSINPRTHPVTVHHVLNDNLEQMILDEVGASKRLDCLGNWVPNRDAVDQRLIYEYLNGTGQLIFNPDEVGGFPTIAGGTPCQDTDGDGMPDQWEIARGLNPNNAADRNHIHSSGYTMLEMYLNGPMEGGGTQPPPPPPCVEPCILRFSSGLVNTGNSFNITFPSPPAEGNKLIFISGVSAFEDNTRTATISGFTQVARMVNGNATKEIMTKTAGASEGATYAVSFSGDPGTHSGIMLEIQGTNNDDPFNALALTDSLTTLSRTPTVAGVRPITALVTANVPNNFAPDGWANLIEVRPNHRGLSLVSRPLGNDITTAYSATWESGTDPISTIMLINPSDYEPPEPDKTIVPPSGLRYVR